MLDFDLTEEQKLLEQSIREWGAREVAPKIRELDRQHRFDKELIIGGMKHLGLLGISVPQEYGGAGMDYVGLGIASEELEYVDTSLRVIMSATRRLMVLDELCRDWKTSRFLDGVMPRYLGALTAEDTRALIGQAQSPTPEPVDEVATRAVMAATAGHPFLTQWLCNELWSEDGLRLPEPGDLRQGGQPPILWRLRIEHVETRAAHVSVFDRVGKGCFVDELAPCGVDDADAFLASCQPLGIEKVARRWQRRHMERDVIGARAQIVERDKFYAKRRGHFF